MSSDVIVLGELRRQTAVRGHCSLSTRQFYELSGIGRKTVQRSLSRLAEAGLARRVQVARGGASARWVALQTADWEPLPGSVSPATQQYLNRKPAVSSMALMDPGKGAGFGQGVIPDAFRRSDLRSPWLLYEKLPDGRAMSLDEVMAVSETSRRRRTVEWWLLILASLVPPLVDASSADGDCDWIKLHVQNRDLEAIAAHLDDLSSRCGGRRLHTGTRAQLQNQMEREMNLWRGEPRRG